MNIAIDGYEANIENRVGIGRYAFEILSHVYRLRRKHFFRIYLPTAPLWDMPKERSWWRYKIVKPKTLWTFFGLPRALIHDKPNVIFSPTHYIPRYVKTPRVMAIMDLSYIVYPQMFRKEDLHKLTHWTAYGVEHAKRILTISEYSKNAIIKEYGVPAGRVAVTYPGMSTITKTDKKFPLLKKYILSVGTIQPRKNYVRLIEAFATLQAKFPDVTLVIAGKKGWLWEETLGAPKKFRVETKVKFLDFVPDRDLPSLYTNAQCFALVSLYEGFGLPILEAMTYKRPVVVSDVSSIPEIAGSAGVYVDPTSVKSIASGLERALTEDNTERIKQGLSQVKKFSWEKAAKQTLEVLEEVGKENI